MYFDELYFGVFISALTAVAQACMWIDDKVLDNIVNAAPTTARKLAKTLGRFDDRFVDGTALGIAGLAGRFGGAVRATQTGRIRGYVTLAIGAAAVVMAVAVIVALSK